MPVGLDIKIDFGDIARLERKGPRAMDWALQRILSRAAQQAARDMKVEAPKAFSTLANSVQAEQTGKEQWSIRPHVQYAEYVFQGRAPGRFPPFQPIYDWVRVKGIGGDNPEGAAWAIRRKIGLQGTQGQDFITPVYAKLADDLPNIQRRIIDQALGRI